MGAGACGLIAAIAARLAGEEVVVLEKLDRYAGNTTLSSGSIPAADTRFQRAAGIEDSPTRMAADLRRLAGPHEAETLVDVFSRRSAEVVEWLADAAQVNLRLITFYKHVGHTVPRLHGPPSGRGADLLADLARRAESLDIPVLFSNPVRELVIDAAGAVIGVTVSGDRIEPYSVRAKRVVLATNGYGRNRALVERFCGPIAAAPYFGAAGSEGEAVDWGESVGARLANMGAYQGHAGVAYPHGALMTWTVVEKGGLYVDAQGDRFGNEAIGYSAFAEEVLKQSGPVHAIYDARIRDFTAEKQETFRELVAMGAARESRDLDELARLTGIDPVRLKRTVESFNRAAASGGPDAFGRADFGLAPLAPPFVATRVEAGLFHTQGGLLVDEHARVLRADGTAIPGLYAGGGAAAGVSGVHGGTGYASGAGLLAACVLGYLAGRDAA